MRNRNTYEIYFALNSPLFYVVSDAGAFQHRGTVQAPSAAAAAAPAASAAPAAAAAASAAAVEMRATGR